MRKRPTDELARPDVSILANAESADPSIDRVAEAVWVAAQRRRWSSLVIIQVERTASAVQLAHAIAVVGSAQRGEPVNSLDLCGLALSESRAYAEQLADRSQPYHRVAVVDSPLQSQTALLLSRAADAAVVVVERDRTPIEDIRTILDRVGRERFVGAVVVEVGNAP